jgi:hypothetical protein
LATFVRRVAVLALPAGQQVSWIRSRQLGSLDGLGLGLGDRGLLVQQFSEVGWISPDVLSLALGLDALLASRSDPSSEEYDALRESPDWVRARRSAQALLCQIR